MLKARIMTALVLLGIFLPVLWLAPLLWLGILIALVITLASWEWWRLLFPNNKKRAISYAGICLLNLAAWVMYADLNAVVALLCITVAFWVLIVPLIMRQSLEFDLTKWKWLLAISGLLIFPACWFALMHLRGMSMTLFLSVLILVWTADIGAYFVGKSFGRNKLAIRLSPGKSIEGAIGGGVLVLIVALLGSLVVDDVKLFQLNFFDYLNQSIGWLGMIAVTIICVLMSIQGDLFESQLKRIAGVKDSSHLLPGHGGFLDRIDALLPVLPLAGLIIILITQ